MEEGQRSEYSDWLLAVQSGVRFGAGARYVILPKPVQTVAGTHPANCSVGTTVLS